MRWFRHPVWLVLALLVPGADHAEQSVNAKQLVQEVVNNELAASANDHSLWMYRDADKTPGKSTVKLVVGTANGQVSRTIELDGHPLTPEESAKDEASMREFVHDSQAQAKQRRNNQQDDRNAVALMKMLPEGFLWSEQGQSDGDITLEFKPNPAFNPPTRDARVFAAMEGTMVIDQQHMRLKSLSGRLTAPVEFGWGILGKLDKGGTFHIERQEIAPGEWQTTGTHVHIKGHMLIFKSISEQQDEETSDYKPTPPSTTLAEAANLLANGTVAKDLDISIRASSR